MSKYRCYIYVTIILSLLCVNTLTFAATIDVPADRPTIQSGINAAKDGDTVLVADGIYKGEGNVNIDFKGKQITVKSQNGAKSTTVDCEKEVETRGFTFHNEETNDSVLDGFTIRNGVHELGGGIYCNNASPTIKNSVIAWNRADMNKLGTGIYAVNSDMKIIDSTISNNWTGVRSEVNDRLIEGEFRNFQSTLINCTVSENRGTGVSSISASTVIKDSEVSKNSGRGIATSFSGRMYITNCLISQNTGGVGCYEFSSMKITDSIIRQNTARDGGGIICNSALTVEISDCIIAENIATRRGGGITIVESKWGDVEITHCTITRNSASERGGGVYAYIKGSVFTLSDSIIWGNNSDNTHAEVFVFGGRIVIKSNDIRDGLDGIGREPDGNLFTYEDNIDADPLFVDADRGDYRLKGNSPAAAMGVQSSSVREVLSVTSIAKRLVMWGELKRK